MVFPILGANTESAAYEISNSLRFDGSSSYLYHTHESGNKDTFTFSFWIKFGDLDNDSSADVLFSVTNTGYVIIRFEDKQLDYLDYDGSDAQEISTNRLFRDVSAWYHIVVAVDMTQSTDSNRIKLYVNGSQETSFATANYQPQNQDTVVNTAAEHRIGRESGNYFSGYMADINFIDGTQYAPTDFGETNNNGVWIPKKFTGSYGTNGYFLEFKQTGTSANASGIGADTSGQGNHHSVSGLAAIDVTTDTPTNNFATLNPLNIRLGIGITHSEGNLQVQRTTTGGGTAGAFSTIAGLKRGKWYAEFKPTTVNNSGILRFGIEDTDFNAADGLCNVAASAYASNGNKGRNATDTSHGDSYDDGDIVGVALDLDNGAIYFSKNGTWQNSSNPESGSSKTGAAFTDILTILPDGGYMFAFNFNYSGGEQDVVQANFGNPVFSISSGNSDGNGYGNFEYAVPSGYYSLCTKNLAEFG